MKRDEFLRRIRRKTAEVGIEWSLVRHGAEHELWRCGSTRIVVPRHREVNELVAQRLLRQLEGELGQDWWR